MAAGPVARAGGVGRRLVAVLRRVRRRGRGQRGAGFAPDFASRAFERFSRGDGSRDTAGAGLGLAIVLAIAQAHGGTAIAANRREGGAAVTLRLPRPR